MATTAFFDRSQGWTAQTAITATTSAPSSASDGTETKGGATLAIALHTPVSLTTVSIQIWVYAYGLGWCKVNNGSYTGITAAWAESFDVRGWDRFAVQVTTWTGTSLQLATRCG